MINTVCSLSNVIPVNASCALLDDCERLVSTVDFCLYFDLLSLWSYFLIRTRHHSYMHISFLACVVVKVAHVFTNVYLR